MDSDKQGFFRETQQLAEDYVKERILLLKLQLAEKTAKLASIIAAALVIGMFLFLIVLFVSLIAVYLFWQLTGSLYVGFGIVTALYILLVCLLFYFRKAVLYKFIENLVIRTLLDNTENDR